MVLLNLLMAACLVSPYFSSEIESANHARVGERLVDFLGSPAAYYIAQTNWIDVVLALLFVSLTVVLLMHRVLWPLLSRPLFRMQDIGTKGRRAILTAVGLSLLTGSFFGGKVPEWLKEILKGFSGYLRSGRQTSGLF
ncbi:MAG: hypothetical protein ACLPW4_12225 [Candidatus Sulfotelmatobacter sp.]